MVGDHEHCEGLLAEAWSEAEGTIFAGFRVNITLVRAYSALARSDREEAHSHIRRMLALGRCDHSWRFLQAELVLREVVLEEAPVAGIDTELARTIIRSFGIKPRRPDIDNWPWLLKVSTLGKFEVLVNDEPLESSRKSPRRPLALLKALIAFGSREVPGAKLVDALWAEEDGDAAQRDFDVALYRLRKLLGDPKAILFEDAALASTPPIAGSMCLRSKGILSSWSKPSSVATSTKWRPLSVPSAAFMVECSFLARRMQPGACRCASG